MSRSSAAEDRLLRGLAEASFLFPLGFLGNVMTTKPLLRMFEPDVVFRTLYVNTPLTHGFHCDSSLLWSGDSTVVAAISYSND